MEDESVRPLLLPVLRSPLIRRVMSDLIAPDYVLHGCTAYVAAPSASGKENTWHYDFDYQIPEFRLAARTALAARRSHYAAAMLYLQDADASNGATRIVKGSHHWPARDPPFLPPGQFLEMGELVAAWEALRYEPPIEVVDAEIRAGRLLFFQGGALHTTGGYKLVPPLDAANASHYRYAVVFHFASQHAPDPKYGVLDDDAPYLRGANRKHVDVAVDGTLKRITFDPHHGDLDLVARAFVSRHRAQMGVEEDLQGCGHGDHVACDPSHFTGFADAYRSAILSEMRALRD